MRTWQFAPMLLVATIVMAAAAQAAGPDAQVKWETNADEAWTASLEQKRPLLVYLTTPGCHYCNLMKRRTYRDPNVACEINKSFVAISLDHRQAAWLVKALGVRAYPTTVVISPRLKKVVARFNGYVPAQDFKKRLAAVAAKNRTVKVSALVPY